MLFVKGGREQMKKATERFKSCMKKAAGEEIDTLSGDSLELYQTAIQMIDAANLVIADQENALEAINEKLDEMNKLLLEKGRV